MVEDSEPRLPRRRLDLELQQFHQEHPLFLVEDEKKELQQYPLESTVLVVEPRLPRPRLELELQQYHLEVSLLVVEDSEPRLPRLHLIVKLRFVT